MADSDAFISYSHTADGDLAPALEAGLQRLAKPWNQRRAMEVFLDQQDLSASPHLWSSIVVALDGSDWFLLLASPESAGSYWVGREITHWLSVPERRERMLVVLTAGTMQWADGDFTDDSDAVNPALRGAFEEEPLYVDMTQVDRSITLDLRNPLFKERVATLAATIRHTTVGDLIGEDTRQYHRARRLRRVAVGALGVLTVGALIASVVALQQRSEAQSQRTEAESQRNEAVRQKAEADAQRAEAEKNANESRARELAALALDTMADDPAVASLLAVEANYPNGALAPIDVVEARTALGVTLRSAVGSTTRSVGARIDGDTIVAATPTAVATVSAAEGTVGPDNSLASPNWWNADTGQVIDAPVSRAEELVMMSPIGKRFPFTDVIVAPEVGAVPVKFDPVVLDDANEVLYGVDLATGELIGQSASGDGTVTMRGTVPVGVDLVQLVVGPSSDVYGVVAGGGVYRWSHLLGGEPSIVPLQSVRSLSAAGDLLVAELGQQVLDALGRPAPNAGSAADLHLLMVDGLDYRPVVEGMSDGEPTVPGSLVVSPDDRYLAAIAEGDGFEQSVLVWDMRTTRRLATLPMSQPYQVMWASNDRFAVASARGIDQFQVVPRSVDVVVDADQLAMAGDGSAVAVTAADAADVPLVVRGALSAQGAVPGSYQGRPNGVVALDRHGAFVASTVFDDALNAVVVHRVADGKEVARFEDASAAAFVADADVLAVATFEGVDLIDATDWTVVDQIPLPDGIDGVSDLRWAADGRHLLMLGYEFETNRVLWLDTDGGVSTSITSVDTSAIAVAPSATMAAVGDLAGEVRLFSLGNGARDQPPSASFVASSTVISGLGFSPDGRRLVVSSQNSTTVWDVSDPVAPRRLQVVTSLPRWSFRRATGQQLGGVTADPVGDGEWGYVAFRPDGRSFVMAGSSGMVEVPDFDPQLACSLASQRDLEAVATILDAPSACLRVPGLTN